MQIGAEVGKLCEEVFDRKVRGWLSKRGGVRGKGGRLHPMPKASGSCGRRRLRPSRQPSEFLKESAGSRLNHALRLDVGHYKCAVRVIPKTRREEKGEDEMRLPAEPSPKRCSVANCARWFYAKGLCATHYRREHYWRQKGKKHPQLDRVFRPAGIKGARQLARVRVPAHTHDLLIKEARAAKMSMAQLLQQLLIGIADKPATIRQLVPRDTPKATRSSG